MRRRLLVPLVIAALIPVVDASHAIAADKARISGSDRFATAAAISAATFSPGVPVAFVATGANYPDALAGGPAAAKQHGPILLVDPDSVPQSTEHELQRLQPASIVVLGGTTAVSDTVVAALGADTGGAVTRVAGGDRFATAAQLSAMTFAAGIPVVYVANGGGYADALAAGPAAGAAGGAVLLVTKDTVPGSIADELTRLKPGRIVILGGTAVVSDAVEAALRSYSSDVSRAAGADRFATSVAVSTGAFAPGVPDVFLATGAGFADALAGGPAAAGTPGPILLVQSTCVPDTVNDEIDRLTPGKVVILGGASAVGQGAEDRTTCPPTPTGPSGPPGQPSVTPSPAPAFDDDAPDPDLVRFGSSWYTYTTGTTWGNNLGLLVSSGPASGWATATGQPFGSTAIGALPGWQRPGTQTSPGVFAWGGHYVMFYDAQLTTSTIYCISVATSSSPTGPFMDGSSGPLICQSDLGGSIDPQPFVDRDGRPWLYWKNNDGSSPAVSQVWAVPLAADGRSLAGAPVSVMAKDSVNHPWEVTLDDPQMVIVDGTYYLFFSGGDWTNDSYVVGYAICSGVTGPCTQPSAGPILASYGATAGTGGGTVAQDQSGRWWLAYAAWDKGCTLSCGGSRKLYVAPLSFN